MIYSFSRRMFCADYRVAQALSGLVFVSLSLSTVLTFAQRPSNVYRPPNDAFQQRQQVFQQPVQPRVIYPQQYQTIPQGRVIQQQPYTYPAQGTPVYQQPLQQPIQQPLQSVPGQLLPSTQTPVNQNATAENTELKRSLVKARDLLEKFQIRLDDASQKNQQLEAEIAKLQGADMGDQLARELTAAKASVAEAQQKMTGLNNQLQTTQQELRTSNGALDRQKQIEAGLQEQIASLQKATQMAAGSENQVAELTQSVAQFKNQNATLSEKMNSLQDSLREKEAQLAKMGSVENEQLADLKQRFATSQQDNQKLQAQLTKMGSGDNEQLADLKQRFAASEETNEKLQMKLLEAQENSAAEMAPQADPAVDQLRQDNKMLAQQKQQLETRYSQLESKNSQLDEMLRRVESEKVQLDETIVRLQNMPKPQVDTSSQFAATPQPVAPSPDLSGLRNQLASVTRKNKQLERKVKLSKSELETLTAENLRLREEGDSTEVVAAPVAALKVDNEVAAIAAPAILDLPAAPKLSSAKYWIFGMLGIGLFVGLAVAWYESVLDPKSRRTVSQ